MERPIGSHRTRPGASANPHRAAQILAEAENCRRTGKLDRARTLCESLLQQYPDYVGALQTLGVTQLTQKNYRQALSCFIEAAMHCSKDPVNLTNLATAYLRLGARELSVQALEQARRLKPDDADIDLILAEVYREAREYELAAECYRKVINRTPSYAEAAHGLGDCCIHLGQLTEAAAHLEQAHELKPESLTILYALSQLPRSANRVLVLQALEGVGKSEGEDQADFDSLVLFTRAAALDQLGRHPEAWTTLLEANRREFPKHQSAYAKQLARMQAARQAALTQSAAEAMPKAPQPQPLSLFIIGPSRSGKTTVEQLVKLLEGVKCGYENRLVERATRRTSQLAGLLTMRNPIDLPKALDEQLRTIYLEELLEFADGAKIITDTYPAMVPYVGRVATTIPNVRFIFVKRDRYDCALRIFMKHYRAGNDYAYSVETIFEYVSWYYDMAEIWSAKFPGLTLSVEYDQAVAEPKATLSRLADFCGMCISEGPLPQLGDDRGCSQAYGELLDKARQADAVTPSPRASMASG
jgi:tetratricopeptide (TPR) repeat protein